MRDRTLEEWLTLCESLRRQGDHPSAINACNDALKAFPGNARLLSSLAHALRFHGSLVEAQAVAQQATWADPFCAPGWFNLGAATAALGDPQAAIDAYRRAIRVNPDYAEAWSNLGGVLEGVGHLDEAIAAYRNAVSTNPSLAPAWSNLCKALTAQGRFEEAVGTGKSAVGIDPAFAPAWVNLGNALHEARQDEQALATLQRACALAPTLAEAHLSLGLLHKRQGRYADAVSAYRRALSIKPDLHDAAWGLSLALLALGDLREGWALYEARWRRLDAPPPRYATGLVPRLAGRVLVWGEQGIGDELLFASMAPDAARMADALTWEADGRLIALLRRSFPDVEVIARSDSPSVDPRSFDHVLPAASLGAVLRPSFGHFPKRSGFLKPDPGRTEELSASLRSRGTDFAVVGISWASKNVHVGDSKSLPLASWAPVLSQPRIRFVSLQYGDTATELANLDAQLGIEVARLPGIDLFNDIDDLAALIAACDLVITTSNVTAHIAGGLGRPVWTLLPLRAGRPWCWFTERADSPWYPSMQLLSQHREGEWDGLIEDVGRKLRDWSAQRRQPVQ